MTDISLEQFEQLLDKRFSQNEETVATRIGELANRVDEGFAKAATTAQIDTVATHLATFSEHLGSGLDEQAKTLERIERRLNSDLDRLDDHGQRIEALEDKTAHLPTTTS